MKGSINTPGVSWAQLLEALKGKIAGVEILATKLFTPRKISLTGEVSGETAFDGSQDVEIPVTIKKAPVITAKGIVHVKLEENREYSFTEVTSLEMPGAAVNAHGFVTFASVNPAISNKGFTGSSGDDINEAKASEIWEFSVYPHNGGSFIIWKNWSA